MICVFRQRGNGIGLNRITDTEGSYCSKYRKEDTCPFPAESSFQCIHRPTEHLSFFCLHPVFDREQSLCIFRGYTEYTCKPAPEHSTWSTQSDGSSHTDDITCTDCGSQCSGERSEL